jgi:hypothetical protein
VSSPLKDKDALEKKYVWKTELGNISPTRLARLREMFDVLVDEGKTEINTHRFQEFLAKPVPGHPTLSEDQAKRMVSLADVDDNGTIDFTEFCLWFEPIPGDAGLRYCILFLPVQLYLREELCLLISSSCL